MKLNKIMTLGVILTFASPGLGIRSAQGASATQLRDGGRAGLNQLYR